jgi:hypothetical protein
MMPDCKASALIICVRRIITSSEYCVHPFKSLPLFRGMFDAVLDGNSHATVAGF